MVQGTVKKPKPQNSKRKINRRKKGLGPAPPKKSTLKKQAENKKKISAGLTAKTERILAERAGHLELLGGSKK